MFPARFDKAAATFSIVEAQSPGRGCRNRRMDGYHGVSLRSTDHRQSGPYGWTVHTGLLSAPAICATTVSTVITTSRLNIIAAVSMKVRTSGVGTVSGAVPDHSGI